MTKLLVLKGLPSSGKSTFARKWVNESPNTRVRINRDDIRNMLGPYWVPQREDLVTSIENAMIVESLWEGFDTVVDATNLRGTQRFEELNMADNSVPIRDCSNIEIEVKDFTDVPVETCIERDKNRPEEEQVGEQVIRKFAQKYSLS